MKSKNASQKSTDLLAHFIQKEQVCFTTQDAARALENTNLKTLSELLSAMSRRGLLMKIKHGIYYVIPYEAKPETFMPDWHFLVQYIVGDAE